MGFCHFVLIILRPMKYFSHLHTAVQLIEQYRGNQPFGDYAKDFFRGYKKYGSTDRRQILQLCYAGFRTGKALIDQSIEARVLAGLFLCSPEPNVLLEHLKPEWNEKATLPVEEKLAITGVVPEKIFPWTNELSEGIDEQLFSLSFLVQPDLFLRLRPGMEIVVKDKLKNGGINYKEIADSSLALPNSSKADAVVEMNKEAVIQDLSSQRVGRLMAKAGEHARINSVWDCCAGSGGKSIMAFDRLDKINLTVSDVREMILDNLANRFEAAGIKSYSAFSADLASNKFNPHNYLSSKVKFDLIMADVPCTGSGTWSRTPEHLSFFDTKQIAAFSLLQKNIVSNVLSLLSPGGAFLYITCSVFKKENEEVVDFIQEQHGLKLHTMELLKGYNEKADSMFVALFTA